MPRIFDNIDTPSCRPCRKPWRSEKGPTSASATSTSGDGGTWPTMWGAGQGAMANAAASWSGCRLHPSEELRRALKIGEQGDTLDNQTALREKRRLAEDFRRQLAFGVPTNTDEAALRQLAGQLRDKKLFVKVYLPHPLHAKLYLVHRRDANNPMTGFVGSSNLTMAGLARQGELNVDVLEHDACTKLADWFEDRWRERWCIDISKDLADIIDESWAADRLVPPYHVYLKMAYHLAQEARAGLLEFRIPAIFGNALFDFQVAAVKIAAHHLNKRGGVLIGDVVGLGKSLMATALAKIFEDDHGTETLILCPKNLVSMWEDYVHRYRLHAKVMSLSRVMTELPEKTRRYRIVLIDESHNLRNKEGKRWRVIRDYIDHNDSQCILLSATPYNKTYLDLSAQTWPVPERGRRHRHPPGTQDLRPGRRARVHPPPSMPGPLTGRVRQERRRRRLARPDAPLHGAPHARLHHAELRPRGRARALPAVPRWHQVLLPAAGTEERQIPDPGLGRQ